jgi:hypothetical protein
MELNKVIDVEIDPRQIQVRPSNILDLLGYNTDIDDEHTKMVIDLCLKQAEELILPKGGIIFLRNGEIDSRPGNIRIGKLSFQVGRIIASQLKKSEYAAFFICTVGAAIGNLSRKQTGQGNLLEGYVLDLIGSEAAEETASFVHETIKDIVSIDGLKITNRYSPGYCNWDVVEQFKLFQLFGTHDFGISLTDSALMDPVKSVSAIVGIGENVDRGKYSCSICGDKKCIYRNRKSRTNE